ncbi:outer membrane protein assembly factor BamE domain-containing protein [Paenibacillus kobensis]|uniref:outer membrane protein assembly factor BamE domain-containing protein n=1 Tax=Paenibacillus kobensis TaxID=59841 RepID=UPI000FDA6883|nr:outer membrane protein assembly factor BamE [Paenibacillus kobensis]
MRIWSTVLLLTMFFLITACQNQTQVDSLNTKSKGKDQSISQPSQIASTSDDVEETTSPSTPSDYVMSLDDWVGKWVLHSDEGDSLLYLSPEKNQPGHLYFQLFEPRMKDDRLKPYEYSGVFAVKSIAGLESADFNASPLKLSFKRDNDLLEITAIGVKDYFGNHTELGGRYKKYIDSKGQANKDNLIVPGISVGKVKIGMTKEDVNRILGKPSREDEIGWIYSSTDRKRFIQVKYYENQVVQIDFNSSSFMTEDLIGIGTFDKPYFYGVDYKLYKFQWRFLQLRYDYDTPGLSFYSFNVDSEVSDENTFTDKLGSVYMGNTPRYQPIEGATWVAWDGRS